MIQSLFFFVKWNSEISFNMFFTLQSDGYSLKLRPNSPASEPPLQVHALAFIPQAAAEGLAQRIVRRRPGAGVIERDLVEVRPGIQRR